MEGIYDALIRPKQLLHNFGKFNSWFIVMSSTKKPNQLPDRKTLQSICKAIAVVDAILSQDWEYRYFSYNCKWAKDEEFFEMRDGEGSRMLILFHKAGCVINGFDAELSKRDKKQLTKGLPKIYQEFIFGEPVKTYGTTFCLWTTEQEEWVVGEITDYKDSSKDFLSFLNKEPKNYIEWATEYFAGSYKKSGIPTETVQKIYNSEVITKEMVLSIVDTLDWNQLKEDLAEINYPFKF